jgi:hypothetical protein
MVAAREVAVRAFDLDDARTGISQPRTAIRRRHRLFE